MPVYVICYVERSPGAAPAKELIAQRVAERWGGELRLNGTWIVTAERTSDEIRDELSPLVREQDALIVIGAGIDASWHGFTTADNEWLIEHI